MKKLNFKSNLLSTLPNIENLDNICKELYLLNFQQEGNTYIRKYKPKIQNISEIAQKITINEKLNLSEFKNNINLFNFCGDIFSTALLDTYLKYQPLPLSAQKQELIESAARMNNFKLNEAECIYIEQNVKPTNNNLCLEPNLSSQFSTELHYNQKSRLTLGESQIEDQYTHKAFGSALLQISHLSYHSIDLDLSLRMHFENKQIITQKLLNKVKRYQYCFTIPYRLNNTDFSQHGFIVTLKGKNITPEKISKLFGTKYTAYAGITIASGIAKGKIETINKTFLQKNKIKTEISENYLEENIGNFIFDPGKKELKDGHWTTENIGRINTFNGELVMLVFPILQTFNIKHK